MSARLLLAALILLGACKKNAVPLSQVPGHDALAQDTTPKQAQRLIPAESYLRSYLMIFGSTDPLQTQTALRATTTSLFDSWTDYLAALGVPDYKLDAPRQGQTNALMVAAFERLGVALCDRSLELDLQKPVGQRQVYDFAIDDQPMTADRFAQGFDVLHRTFLGYPLALAPADRADRFFALFQQRVASSKAPGAPKKLTANQAGWASMCYGMVRHPEFHLY
jgi:hypothetical protein